MMKKLRKLAGNKSGFTLTEVMIGIMILTVAIVTATNLLNGLIRSNRNNVLTLKAYYFAQEGVEAVRNIRDTNWLHNVDFKGDGGVYSALEVGKTYSVFLNERGWANSTNIHVVSKDGLGIYLPWRLSQINASADVYHSSFALSLKNNGFYSSVLGVRGDDAGDVFYRHIDILSSCEDDEDCEDFILVRSVVNWRDGSKDREVVLETVLSNWKGGVI